MPVNDEEREAAIQRLVQAGTLTPKAEPGTVVHTKSKKGSIPDYDTAVIREAMPHVKGIKVMRELSSGTLYAELHSDDTEKTTVPLGKKCPPTSAELVDAIQEHYHGQLDTDVIDETAKLFEKFETME